MADLFIIKERLRFCLKLLVAGIGLGLFATWYYWNQFEFSTDQDQFFLSAAITGGLVVGWLGIMIFYRSISRVVNPEHSLIAGFDIFPWWTIKLVTVMLTISVTGFYIVRTADQTRAEFDLIRRGDIEVLKERIEANPSVLEKLEFKGGPTLLQMAYREGYYEMIGVLVEAGADVEGLDEQGRNPVVASLGNLPLLKSLLAAGFSPEAQDAEGLLPIHYAVALHSADIIAVLLEAGADIDARDKIYRTPLFIAIESDDIPMIESLLEMGAGVNEYDKRGDTPLHKAARRRNKEIIRLLLDHGANPRIFNFVQMTPLHIVAQGGHDELVSIFLELPDMAGLHVENGPSPLYLTLKNRKYKTAKLLITHGSNVDEILINGNTLLHQAILERDYQIARFLIREGCDVHLLNTNRESAYDIMRRKQLNGLLDLVEMRDNPSKSNLTNMVETVESP